MVSTDEFSPESQEAVVTNIGSSARSATQVQSVDTEDITSARASVSAEFPIADQEKGFTQAESTPEFDDEDDMENKTIRTGRITDGVAPQTRLASRLSSSEATQRK